MRNIEQFYNELKTNFKKINQLELWDEYDWSENGHNNSFIMKKLAQEICTWDLKREHDKFSKLFQIIEEGFSYYDKVTSSMLATDFLVTIMENENKVIRDDLKKLMNNKTRMNYNNMLNFYKEL